MAPSLVGTSGYVYDHWRGAFYPERLAKAKWFPYYADRFRTVEINNTYYQLAREKAVARWLHDAPEGFGYVFKAHRYITHYRRLARPEEPLEKFFSALRPLRERTLAILYQLPDHVPRDDARLRAFLRALPEGWRAAFEFRDRSWFADDVYDLLGEFGATFVVHDWPQSRPVPIETTADLVYLRFHGVQHAYAGLYGARRLAPWLARIERWRKGGHQVLAYFNNDQSAYAAKDAAWLAHRVEGREVDVTVRDVAPTPRRARAPA